MMRLSYAVTFEFENRAPLTHRGVLEASSASTAARRAVAQAQRTLKPVNWASMAFVILARASVASGADAVPEVEDVEV